MEQIRGQFMQTARLLLAVPPTPKASCATTYVKFTTNGDSNSPVFAAVWLKSSKQMIVGLALPKEYEVQGLGAGPPKTLYKGLTKYFVVECGGMVPQGLAEWAKTAYQNALIPEPWAGFVDQRAAKGKQGAG